MVAKRNLIILFLMFIGYAPSVKAQLSTVVGAVAHANGSMLANPPLPILYNKKDASKFSIQPGFFYVTESADGDVKDLDYDGYGLALMYSHYFTNRLGYYLLGAGTQVKGDITAPGQNNSGRIYSTDIDSVQYMLSGGLALAIVDSSWLSLSTFGGPAFVKGEFASSFRQVNDSGSTIDDFDAETSPSSLGYLIGVQAGIHFGRHFTLNPYFVMLRSLDSDKCHDFKTTEVRVYGNLFDRSSMNCEGARGNSQNKVEFDSFVQSFGVNLLFPSIGLGVNAYAEAGDVPLFEGTKIQMFFLSLSFGTP